MTLLKQLEDASHEFADTKKDLSNYIITGKYSNYLEDEKRRETWEEAVARVELMHLKKFDFLNSSDLLAIIEAFNLVRDKKVAPSMRSLQFGGKAIEAHNARIFNCAVRHVDSLRSFSELFYLLLCGAGTGIGLFEKYLSRLPDLVSESNKTGIVVTYVVEDTIEGWADSVEALLSCYFVNTAWTGRKIVFDFSRIREEGSKLKTSGGRAPGYKGLKAALSKIKSLLDNIIENKHQSRLFTVDAYDVCMHMADAVLSGGVRRSATSVMFSKNDDLMMNAKTGNWLEVNPQRARSNNSVLLVRNESSKEEFDEIIKIAKEWGEPGFVFADSEDVLYNPCQPAWAPVLTPGGISTMGEISEGDSIWSETGWTKVVKKWSTGVKKVYRYTTTAGSFYGTENHRLVSGGVKVEAQDAESVDVLRGPSTWATYAELAPEDIMAGLMIGDGTPNHKTGTETQLVVGENDQDYFTSEISDFIGEKKSDYCYVAKTEISHAELIPLPFRVVPERFYRGDQRKVAGFLRGLYSANGSVVRDRVTLKTSSAQLRDQAQLMLSSIGIRSYFTTNKASDVEFDNGTYACKESYDVNITSDRAIFFSAVGFIQQYKMEKLDKAISMMVRPGKGKASFDVTSVDLISEEEVFDITVDNDPHTYWTGGLNVSNCFEISFIPVTDDGVCGVQVCNLTTVNGGKVYSKEDFVEYSKAAALIGTLQAAYTNFPYLSNTAKELTEGEALLGVSVTAMMEHPEIILDPEVQREAAAAVVEVNKEWAKKLGINQAARCTAIKPEGTSTLAYESMFSGIHAAHSKFMFRRVQANKLDPVYQHFNRHNKHATEASLYSANNTDDSIIFPVYNPTGIVKEDLSALAHLDIIRSTQQNWVMPGTTEANSKPILHNVSCTVVVGDDEWDDVSDYLYENKKNFAAVSLLSKTGDKDYAQAPMEAVTTQEDVDKFLSLMREWQMVDYSTLTEEEDVTTLSQEAACAGGACEVIYT